MKTIAYTKLEPPEVLQLQAEAFARDLHHVYQRSTCEASQYHRKGKE